MKINPIIKRILAVMTAALLSSCGNMIKSGAMVEAQTALTNKQYAKALYNTDLAESFGHSSNEHSARIHYLRAQSLEGLRRVEEAMLSYRYVIEQHSTSAYAPSARQRLNALESSNNY